MNNISALYRFWNTFCNNCERATFRLSIWHLAPIVLKKRKKKICGLHIERLCRFREARRRSRTGCIARLHAEKMRVAAICEMVADRMPRNYDISWGKLACNVPRCNTATCASHDKAPRRFEGKLARCKCVSRRLNVKTTWKKIKGFGQ